MRIPVHGRSFGAARAVALSVCIGLASPPSPARAADPAPDTPRSTAWVDTSWLTGPVSAMEGALKAAGAGAASAWGAIAGAVTPAQPRDSLPVRISDEDRRFFAVLEAVGLHLSEIKVGGTLVSSSLYRLVAAREPSDADIERAERALDDYRARFGGMRARAKQRVIHTVLDLASDRDFLLTAVAVELSPWPSVSYEMTARTRPPEPSERRIVDRLQAQ